VLISSLPPSIPAKSPKEVNNLNRFFKKKTIVPNGKEQGSKSYAQASSIGNVARETLKIIEMFPKLQASKIKNIQNIIHGSDKPKLYINITMKGPSCKQVIIPMNNENKNEFIKNSSDYVININRLFKNIKSECKVDYIRSEKSSVIIVTDKITSSLDLQTIKQYVKSSNKIDTDKVKTLCLLQSKSYLKIISLPYFLNSSKIPVSSDIIEDVIKIFNDINIISRPRIIKFSPKLDMAIIWLDIWDSQNRMNAKRLINCCFNVRKYITVIHEANMNSSVP